MPRRIPEDRLKLVEELLALHWSHRQIVDHVAAEFGCSTRQVWTYLKRVYERLQAEEAKSRPMRKHQMRRALQRVFQAAFSDKQYSPAINALDRLNKLDGLYAPESLRVEDITEEEVTVDEMTTDERRQEIERLLKMRDEVIGHVSVNDDGEDDYGPN